MKHEKIIGFGEIMLRLTPPSYTRIERAGSFVANYGGCEANVMSSLSYFNHETYFITKLPLNQLGDSVVENLRSNGVHTDYVKRGSSTLGMYFVETGFGGRPSRVIYNRKHSSFTRINTSDVKVDEIFKDSTWFHVSGISLALGDKVRKVLFLCLEACKKYNVKVSFDFNYRAKLWSIEEATPYYKRVMPYVDVLFANNYDIETILGLNLTDKFSNENDKKIALAKQLISKTHIKYVFGRDRIVYSASDNSLSSYCIDKDGNFKEEGSIRFGIYDRIGAGDAFASGVIHGLLKDYENPDYALKFGLATSVLKHTLYGDVCTLSIKEVEDFMSKKSSEVDR